MAKNTTTYTPVSKNSTSYQSIGAATGIRLDDTSVTLGSLLVYLNGFTTAQAPNNFNGKNATTYTEI